jgi:hypothetical protein
MMMTDYNTLTIKSNKSEGDFVRNLQGATGTGFEKGTHVHKDWWAKTKTYEQVMEDAQIAVQNREDILVATKDISCVSENNDFFLKLSDGRKFRPTDHAIEQFSVRTEVTSSSFLREMRNIEGFDSNDANTMAIVGNNALRRIDGDKTFRLRTYTDGTCRAFVTDKYAPVDNRWYLETLAEFVPGGRFSHWRGDEDTIYGNILIPDTIMDYGADDSDYGGMISVGNCEIGTRRISQTPSLFRAICMNGCIWGQTAGEKIRRVHRGNIDLDSLKLEIAKNIQHQIPLLAPGIKTFLATRAMDTGKASVKGIVATVSSDYKLTKREATEFLEQYITMESGERNLFGIINGLTRAGQKFDNKTWVRFDEIAGSLLETSADRWATILRRADTFTDKDYEKVFALTA